jgi:hypothetical protein
MTATKPKTPGMANGATAPDEAARRALFSAASRVLSYHTAALDKSAARLNRMSTETPPLFVERPDVALEVIPGTSPMQEGRTGDGWGVDQCQMFSARC